MRHAVFSRDAMLVDMLIYWEETDENRENVRLAPCRLLRSRLGEV